MGGSHRITSWGATGSVPPGKWKKEIRALRDPAVQAPAQHQGLLLWIEGVYLCNHCVHIALDTKYKVTTLANMILPEHGFPHASRGEALPLEGRPETPDAEQCVRRTEAGESDAPAVPTSSLDT